MNSTPARSNACLMTSRVARRGLLVPASSWCTVTTPTPAFCASSCWLHASSPRAALHCAGVIIPADKGRSMKFATTDWSNRRAFIGGSDARIIMGRDEAALVQLWREKRGEAEPADLSDNLIVQLGRATEELNRSWYERNTGRQVRDVQRRVKHSAIPWMGATLDGIVEGTEAVFEAKFMLPWSFTEEAAAEKYMAQVQHNMWVTHLRSSALSIITGGGKWVEVAIPMDPLYLTVLVSAEKKFWRCVQSGEV